jgi:hypothetical protein
MKRSRPFPTLRSTTTNCSLPYLYRSRLLHRARIQPKYSTVRKHDVRSRPSKDSNWLLLSASYLWKCNGPTCGISMSHRDRDYVPRASYRFLTGVRLYYPSYPLHQ